MPARLLAGLLTIAVLAPLAPAQTDPDTVLAEAVDPYIPGRQRAAFLRAAGPDSELDASEFEAAAQADKSFARGFDKLDTMMKFDRNRNSRLDWFEMDAYRRALRGAVVKAHDANGDGKLTGEERAKAAAALEAGKLPEVGPGETTGAPAGPEERGQERRDRRERFRERFDADGDGEISDDERSKMEEAMRKRGREQFIKKYDEDGDGVLDGSERAKAMAHPRDKWLLKLDDWGMTHFDQDGDGRLSDQEHAAITTFGNKLRAVGKGWERAVLDTNGDGEITRAERQAMRTKVQAVGLKMLPKAIRWGDTNGDGQVSQDERREAMQRIAIRAEQNVRDWTDRFDADNDGRLDVSERTALVNGIDEDARERYNRHDRDNDGQLDVNEMEALLTELAEEWGVKPEGF